MSSLAKLEHAAGLRPFKRVEDWSAVPGQLQRCSAFSANSTFVDGVQPWHVVITWRTRKDGLGAHEVLQLLFVHMLAFSRE